MRGAFFYTAVIGFAGGIFARSFYTFGLTDIVWVLLLSFASAVVWSRRSKASSAPYVLVLSIFLVSFSIGALRMNSAEWNINNSAFTQKVGEEFVIEGIVKQEPDVRENTTNLYVDIEGETILVSTDRFTNFKYGDELRIVGTLSKPASFETDLGRTFNYPGYLKARDVIYTMRYADIAKISSGNGNPIVAVLLTFKTHFIENIESVLREPQAGLSEGLLLGVKRALGEELETVFRKTGIIHIVVLSGYNIMLVVAFVMYVFAFLLPMRARLVFGLIAVSAFALMVGLSATVVRASIMAALVLIARSLGRTYTVIRALMLAGLAMLCINPYLLAFDTGFQLSFVATLGLILVAPIIEARLKLVPTTIGLREFLTATLATQIFVMPILLYQIGEFSVVSVVVNVLVLPMVPVAMLLTFIAGMIVFVSHTLAVPVAFLAHLSLSYIVTVATFFASFPFASFAVPAFPFLGVVVGYGLLAYALIHFSKKKESHSYSTSDTLNDWVIEEEENVSAAAAQSAAAADTPVFFR